MQSAWLRPGGAGSTPVADFQNARSNRKSKHSLQSQSSAGIPVTAHEFKAWVKVMAMRGVPEARGRERHDDAGGVADGLGVRDALEKEDALVDGVRLYVGR